MNRIPEPDLMNDASQAEAYALADFSEPHNHFVERFAHTFPDFRGEAITLLDLGCGTADVTIRFARRYPGCSIDGIDGAAAMLAWGQRAVIRADLTSRIRLIQGYLPDAALPMRSYGGILCNSLLHHLKEPLLLWNTIKKITQPGSPVFVMDLLRPESEADARALVEVHAGNESPLLQRDFFNSLRAAYTLTEVSDQLDQAGLGHLQVAPVSDRHVVVSGFL